MIKGNIILATTSGSELTTLDLNEAKSIRLRGNNLDLYWFIADKDYTVITANSQALKIKKGQFLIKSNCRQFYYVCNGKATIQDLYDAWKVNEVERIERNKAERKEACDDCISECCTSSN